MSRVGYRVIQEHVPRVHAPSAQVPAKTVAVLQPKGAVEQMFLCPVCDQPRRWLYILNGRWACRKCHKLAYRSENSDKAQRLWLQQQKGKSVAKRMRRLANS